MNLGFPILLSPRKKEKGIDALVFILFSVLALVHPSSAPTRVVIEPRRFLPLSLFNELSFHFNCQSLEQLTTCFSQMGCKDTDFFETCKLFRDFFEYFFYFCPRKQKNNGKRTDPGTKSGFTLANFRSVCEDRRIHHRRRICDDFPHPK